MNFFHRNPTSNGRATVLSVPCLVPFLYSVSFHSAPMRAWQSSRTLVYLGLIKCFLCKKKLMYMSYCSDPTTSMVHTYIHTYLQRVLSINRSFYFTSFHSSCTHGSTSKISPRKIITVLDTPVPTSCLRSFISYPTCTVSFYSCIFPTGLSFSCYWGREDFFTLSFENNFSIFLKKQTTL
jgi:hypothetical protein